MPTQERNPMAVREVCSSRSQKPNVLPTSRKGRPEENPSSNIASVLGRRYSLIRCLCALTRPLCTGASRNTTRTKCIHRKGRGGRGEKPKKHLPQINADERGLNTYHGGTETHGIAVIARDRRHRRYRKTNLQNLYRKRATAAKDTA